MKSNLQFDFLVDKVKNTLTMRREFLANRQLVWDAYTKTELLEQWFAPKPMTTKTKHMDFREGGYWLYAMVEPNGTEYWGRMDYTKIQPVEMYSGLDAFSDENGNLNPALPRATWDVIFSEKGENALVESVVTYNSLSDLETVINMGMEEGMASTLEKLDELLAKLTK
ncbi:SRPBCC domain-containing protein [Chitinophaga sp. SYP-B3965]|uniref:SRPBCC family protein n=1 Tax=Chitinophaga sp. SYP-B3965 TaxID=2663120 RepID=UPI0012996CCF|nr:SRPBCC domain-containing protein [Chitinophaga sp. SYP-B3965]MRG45250.1 SRPBCC domain-containing protein [Chitinophaga sp. SYP-B3965]